MPKKVHKINRFHGGLNNSSDPRDIDDKELVACTDMVVDEVGIVRTVGYKGTHAAPVLNNTGAGVTQTDGSGLFYFSHDRVGGEDAGDDEGEIGDNYLALYDDSGPDIWIYSERLDDWDDDKDDAENGVINFLGKATSAAADPSYFSVDGAIRVSTGEFSKYTSGSLINDTLHFLSTDTALTVDNGSHFLDSGNYLQIDDEIVYVVSKSTHVLTVIRGMFGTKVVLHSDNTIVYIVNMNQWYGYLNNRLFQTKGKGLSFTNATCDSAEHLASGGDFTTGSKWDRTNDFAIDSHDASYTHSAGNGTVVQTAANRTIEGVANTAYSLTYTVSGFSETITIFEIKGTGSQFAAARTGLEQSDGTHTTTFTSHASDADQPFTINVTSSTSGALNIDNLSLTNTTIAHNDDDGRIKVGMFVSGTGIPADAYVASVTSDTSFELSVPTTASFTNGTLTFTINDKTLYSNNKWYNNIQHLRSLDELGIELALYDAESSSPSIAQINQINKIVVAYWFTTTKKDVGFWNGSYWVGLTPVYEGGQEGPISTVSTSPLQINEEILNVQLYITHPDIDDADIIEADGHPLLDERIIGLRLYTKNYTSDEWFLLKEFDLLEGGEHGWETYNSDAGANVTPGGGNTLAGFWKTTSTADSLTLASPSATASYDGPVESNTCTATLLLNQTKGDGRIGTLRLVGFDNSPLYLEVSLDIITSQAKAFDVVNPAPGTHKFVVELLDENFNIMARAEQEQLITDSEISVSPGGGEGGDIGSGSS